MREQYITNNKQREPAQINPKGIGIFMVTIAYQKFIDDVRNDLKDFILEDGRNRKLKIWTEMKCMMKHSQQTE